MDTWANTVQASDLEIERFPTYGDAADMMQIDFTRNQYRVSQYYQRRKRYYPPSR
jgi:hypothetical protein